MQKPDVQIITDTCALYPPDQARSKGLLVAPLSVQIGEESYREYAEISPADFIAKIRAGGIPRSSQPALGDVLALYEESQGKDILCISMADGLSGSYQTACGARKLSPKPEKITVLDSGTLCGPQRYLVNKALALAAAGLDREEILARLRPSFQHHKSYLIPMDFAFLKRGGRLAPWAASLGGLLKLAPLITQTKDGRQLEREALCRTFTAAVKATISGFHQVGLDRSWLISVTHGDNLPQARQAARLLEQAFPDTEIEILELSPVFIAHGGPGCVAIQAILK